MIEYDGYIRAVACLNLVLNVSFLVFYYRYFRFRMLDPVTWYLLFHFFLFALRPVFIFLFGYGANFSYIGFTPTLSDTVATFAVANLGMLAFLLGAVLRPCPTFDVYASLQPTPYARQTFYISALMTLPLILFSIYYAYAHPLVETSAYASGNLVIDPDTGKKVFASGSSYGYVLRNALPGLILALLFLHKPRWWMFAIAGAFMAHIFFTGRGRFVIIYFILSLIIFAFQRSRVSFAKRGAVLASLGGGALLLISIGGIYRRVTRSLGSVSWEDITLSDYLSRTPLGDSQEFGMFEYLTYLVKFFPDNGYGFSFFTQYLEIFTQPIPRALWHDKPVGSPVKLIDLNEFGNFVGLTQSLTGAGWISFGLPGTLFLCFLSGFIFTMVYRFAAKYWYRVDVRALYIVALPFSVQWYRDGAPSIVQFYVFGTYPLILWFLLNQLNWLKKR